MYFKNINEKIAPASLTKLMTSLILIENYNLSDYIEISLPSDYLYEGKVAYLKPCLLYTSPSPRDPNRSRMPSSA